MEQTILKPESAPTKKKLSRAKKQEYLFIASLLVVPIIFFLVFWLYANLDSLTLAFREEKIVDGVNTVRFSFIHFEEAYTDFLMGGEFGLIALRNTMLFFLVNLIIVLPLTLLMAYFIYKKIAGYKIFRTITYLPNIITSAALALLFKYTFMAGGPYYAIVTSSGGEFENLLAGESAIILLLIYNVIFGFGTNMVIFGGAMNSISADVLEAGEIDGCTWFQELIYLIIPMMWPTISTLLILSISSIFSATGPILALTQSVAETHTLAYKLYSYATGVGRGGMTAPELASAIGLILTLITFPLVLLVRKVIFKEDKN